MLEVQHGRRGKLPLRLAILVERLWTGVKRYTRGYPRQRKTASPLNTMFNVLRCIKYQSIQIMLRQLSVQHTVRFTGNRLHNKDDINIIQYLIIYDSNNQRITVRIKDTGNRITIRLKVKMIKVLPLLVSKSTFNVYLNIKVKVNQLAVRDNVNRKTLRYEDTLIKAAPMLASKPSLIVYLIIKDKANQITLWFKVN